LDWRVSWSQIIKKIDHEVETRASGYLTKVSLATEASWTKLKAMITPIPDWPLDKFPFKEEDFQHKNVLFNWMNSNKKADKKLHLQWGFGADDDRNDLFDKVF